MFCPYCGAEAPESSTFCGSCGKRLDSFRQALEVTRKIEETNAAAEAAGETRVIATPVAAGPGVTQMLGDNFDPDKTSVLGDAAAKEELDAMDAVLAKDKLRSYERDFTGLEVIAGEETGYIPASGPAKTSAMPVIDERMIAAHAGSGDAANVVMSAPDGGKKKGKGGRVFLVILVLLIVAGAIGGYLWYSNEQDLKEKAHSTHAVPLSIVAEGYDARATGTPVKVEGTDLDGTAVSGMYYVNSAGEGIELMRGDYTITFAASPIGENGTLWTVPVESITISIPDTIEPYAAFEGAKQTPVTFLRLEPLDVTVDEINRSYEYAKYDPTYGSKAADYRDAAIASHEEAVLEAEAAAEAERIAAEEEAARLAAIEASEAASADGYYLFSFAPPYVDVYQDDFGYWHIEAKKSKTISKAASLDGLKKSSEYVSELVFLLPGEGVSYESSGGTAGVQKLSGSEGYRYFTTFLSRGSAEGLGIYVRVQNGSATFVRIAS